MNAEAEIENTGVDQEVAAPSEEAKSEVSQAETQQHPEQSRNTPDYNWGKMRDAMRAQQKMIRDLQKQVQKREEEEPDEFAKLDPEEVVTVDIARKMAEKAAERAMKKVVRQATKNVDELEQQMVEDYPDYIDVVNKHIPKLIQNDPSLEEHILSSPNKYMAAYLLAKGSEKAQAISPQPKTTSAKAEKILKNASKPVSSNAVVTGSTAGNTGNPYFTQMPKEQIWEMAQKFAKGG